jgi:hypothetical protein
MTLETLILDSTTDLRDWSPMEDVDSFTFDPSAGAGAAIIRNLRLCKVTDVMTGTVEYVKVDTDLYEIVA